MAFEDNGQAWAAGSACFVFILAQIKGATRFNHTLSLHNQVFKI
jgi:hypothetical protein